MREESKSGKSFWGWNPNSKIVKYGLIVIAGIYAITGVYQMVKESLDIKALEKPVTMSSQRRTFVPNGQTVQKYGKTYHLGHFITHEIHLTTENGRTYWIRDTSEDGYFPNDADDLVDLVSINAGSPNSWIRQRFSERLFSALTQKYIQKMAEEDPSKVYEVLRASEESRKKELSN